MCVRSNHYNTAVIAITVVLHTRNRGFLVLPTAVGPVAGWDNNHKRHNISATFILAIMRDVLQSSTLYL